MALEEGYGDGAPEIRVAQLLEALIRNCRYLCALGMHTRGWSVEKATRFFQENAFLEELPARKEAERGTFDPGYGNYTLGKLILRKLRADLRERDGARFDPAAFHQSVLAYGSPPLPALRRLLLGDEAGYSL
jgi:uncharacterized protein (DUF885 family)